jgi:hypothetical protein
MILSIGRSVNQTPYLVLSIGIACQGVDGGKLKVQYSRIQGFKVQSYRFAVFHVQRFKVNG